MAEEELWVKYPDVIRRYTPFILLSMAQGEVIDESYRNNDKYEKRAKRTIDVYGYEDDISEQFHRELITPFVDPFEQAEEERIEEEKEQLRQLEIAKVRKVLEMLKPVQRERLIKAILLGMSSRKIDLFVLPSSVHEVIAVSTDTHVENGITYSGYCQDNIIDQHIDDEPGRSPNIPNATSGLEAVIVYKVKDGNREAIYSATTQCTWAAPDTHSYFNVYYDINETDDDVDYYLVVARDFAGNMITKKLTSQRTLLKMFHTSIDRTSYE